MVNQSDAFYILLLIGMWFVTLVPRIAPPFFWRADKVPPKLSFALALATTVSPMVSSLMAK